MITHHRPSSAASPGRHLRRTHPHAAVLPYTIHPGTQPDSHRGTSASLSPSPRLRQPLVTVASPVHRLSRWRRAFISARRRQRSLSSSMRFFHPRRRIHALSVPSFWDRTPRKGRAANGCRRHRRRDGEAGWMGSKAWHSRSLWREEALGLESWVWEEIGEETW